jgi:hypothetical protein
MNLPPTIVPVLADEPFPVVRTMAGDQSDHPGSVHDKVIWDREYDAVQPLLDRPVLADKAYVRARVEGDLLFRPIKRNERRWYENPQQAKSYNRLHGRWRVLVEPAFARTDWLPSSKLSH